MEGATQAQPEEESQLPAVDTVGSRRPLDLQGGQRCRVAAGGTNGTQRTGDI